MEISINIISKFSYILEFFNFMEDLESLANLNHTANYVLRCVNMTKKPSKFIYNVSFHFMMLEISFES